MNNQGLGGLVFWSCPSASHKLLCRAQIRTVYRKKAYTSAGNRLRCRPCIESNLAIGAGWEPHNYLWTTPKNKTPQALPINDGEKNLKYLWLGV